MNFKLRAAIYQPILRAVLKEIEKETQTAEKTGMRLGLTASCISCTHFDETNEICKKANARPPARIIAFGCNLYDDFDDIPF